MNRRLYSFANCSLGPLGHVSKMRRLISESVGEISISVNNARGVNCNKIKSFRTKIDKRIHNIEQILFGDGLIEEIKFKFTRKLVHILSVGREIYDWYVLKSLVLIEFSFEINAAHPGHLNV